MDAWEAGAIRLAIGSRSRSWFRVGSLVGLVITAPLLILAAIRLYGSYAGQKTVAHREVCLDNLRVIGGALRAYSLDHDDRLPPAATWEDLLLEDTGDPRVFLCPAAPEGAETGYAYYAALSQGSLASLATPADVPMAYDSPKGTWNARDSRPEFPSPPRHGDRNHAVMADGSARSLAPFDVWVEARFQEDGPGGPGDTKALPGFSGPSILFQTDEPVAFRTEHGIEWSAERLPTGYAFRGPEGSRASTTLVMADAEAGLPALAPAATIVRQFEVNLAPEPGAFPATAEVTEVTESGLRSLRVTVQSEPPLKALITVPEDAGDEALAEACLPLTALRWIEKIPQ